MQIYGEAGFPLNNALAGRWLCDDTLEIGRYENPPWINGKLCKVINQDIPYQPWTGHRSHRSYKSIIKVWRKHHLKVHGIFRNLQESEPLNPAKDHERFNPQKPRFTAPPRIGCPGGVNPQAEVSRYGPTHFAKSKADFSDSFCLNYNQMHRYFGKLTSSFDFQEMGIFKAKTHLNTHTWNISFIIFQKVVDASWFQIVFVDFLCFFFFAKNMETSKAISL